MFFTLKFCQCWAEDLSPSPGCIFSHMLGKRSHIVTHTAL